MDKLARMALLYDFYGPLLTEKQRDCLDLHYQQDLSLGEIAEESSTSRQAVHDLLKRTEKILLEYEDKLQLVERHLRQHEKLTKLNLLVNQLNTSDLSHLPEIKRLLGSMLTGD